MVVGRDGTDARTLERREIKGNGGQAKFSPDGTLETARAAIDGDAMPGDIVVVPLDGATSVVRCSRGSGARLVGSRS